MTPQLPRTVLAVDGYAVSLTVDRGQLVVRDGVADERHERRVSRVDPHLQRIVILGDTGTVSLEAIRWCADLGIALVQVDRTGRALMTAAPPGRDDARLRRAQGLAAGTPAGLDVARGLLSAKLAGQAEVASSRLGRGGVAQAIETRAWELDNVQSVDEMRALEAAAAADYFGAWAGSAAARFAVKDETRVPAHWRSFSGRRPPRRGASRFSATDPINALLNYLYALAATEARRACQILGLDPGLGFIHTDKKARDSLALDLLEPVRPAVDTWLLDLLQVRTFTARDFHETRDGTCRILAPLTHELARTIPTWTAVVAPHAEAVAHGLAGASRAPIGTPTPLTNLKRRAAATPSRTRKVTRSPAIQRTCSECGTGIDARATACGACWATLKGARAAADGMAAARLSLASAREHGRDPSHSPAARQLRAASTRATKAADAAWDATHPEGHHDPNDFRRHVAPGLGQVPLSRLAEVTGLSQAACSLIRAGRQVPHPRHWDRLLRMAEADRARTSAVPDDA